MSTLTLTSTLKPSHNTKLTPIFNTNTFLSFNSRSAWMAATAATTTVFVLVLIHGITTDSATINSGSISPNFTASHYLFIENSGDFLRSFNRNYTAAIAKSQPTSPSFYLLIYHTASHAVVWAANRNTPISSSGQLHLSSTGLTINDDDGQPVWSTGPIGSTVAALQLLDSGNLILVDQFNKTMWQSFDFPTDTIVPGQKFSVGKFLTASASSADFSAGEYTFTLASADGLLQWQMLTYYKLSMDPKSIKNSDQPVSYLMVNGSGCNLFSNPGSGVVINVMMTSSVSDYRILKFSVFGNLVVMRYTNNNWVTDFTTPADSCRAPHRCGKLGLCSAGGCSCPPGFRNTLKTNSGCTLSDNSLSLPESCGPQSGSYVYVPIGGGLSYFSIDFTDPVRSNIGLSTCEALCSSNCSCLALFYGNRSGSCYLIENHLGSFISSNNNNGEDVKLGFIKAISLTNQDNSSVSDFPVIGLVLLPVSGVVLILILAIWMSRKTRNCKMNPGSKKLVDDSYTDDLEMFFIAGLPVRFSYDDLVWATGDFSTRVGSGGFGTVYKGVLRDKTVVAVKKITAFGSQGHKEFGTEIAVIGNIHHVNLVKLKGFCTHGRDRFLVYEYMNRGSLDRTLFGPGPPLEWHERFEIAVGTARGLAYLHSGCEHKIIHCDVKPENILLSNDMQVKISDFGLSKLLSPEQSGLFTTMRGTRGYLAPEWLTNEAISDKTDVYSYGMVLLELIQGRKNCGHAQTHGSAHGSENPTAAPQGQSSGSSGSQNRYHARSFYFPLQALEMHEQGRYLDLVDPRLAGRVTNDEAEKLVKVALCCVQEEPSLRPTMASVVAMLEGTLPVGTPRLESLNFLRFYGRRFTEPSTAVTGEELELPSGFMMSTAESSGTGVSGNLLSYISSEQVSGPR